MLTKEVRKTLSTLPPFKKVIVGVSGGADSVALAHILKTLGYEVTMAHLNHSLREEASDEDQQFTEQLAQTWGVPFVSSKIKLPKKGNLENEARKARYAFLERVRVAKSADFIAVAHHQDDQIETILLHMERGAGLRGLRGMSLVSNRILRPLLVFPKSDLLKYLQKQKLNYRTDESNFDLSFRRNRLRHFVIPELKRRNKAFIPKMLQLSVLARERYSTLQKQADQWAQKHLADGRFNRESFVTLPEMLQNEILLNVTGRENSYRRSIEKLNAFIQAGSTGKKRIQSGVTFQIQYDDVVVSASSEDCPTLKKLKLKKGRNQWGSYTIELKTDKEVYVRSWLPGDRFQPNGMEGSKKIQDFFTDSKVPRTERSKVPIFVDRHNTILSISDIRVAKQGDYLKKCLQLKKN